MMMIFILRRGDCAGEYNPDVLLVHTYVSLTCYIFSERANGNGKVNIYSMYDYTIL